MTTNAPRKAVIMPAANGFIVVADRLGGPVGILGSPTIESERHVAQTLDELLAVIGRLFGREPAAAAPIAETALAAAMRALRSIPADWQPCLYAGGPLSVAGFADLADLGLVEIEARTTAGRPRMYWRRSADGNRFLAGVDAAFAAPDPVTSEERAERAAGQRVLDAALADGRITPGEHEEASRMLRRPRGFARDLLPAGSEGGRSLRHAMTYEEPEAGL